MKKKTIIISAIAGIIILGLCVKLAVGSRNVLVIENSALDEEIVSDESNGHDKAAVPERVDFIKPIVKLNGEEGELRYDWNYDSIRVDEDTLLLISDCYFAEERLQQKIFFSGESPVLYTQGGFPAGFQNLG